MGGSAERSVREELTFLSGPLQAGREDDWDLLLHMGLYEPLRGGEVPQLAFPKEGRYRVQMDHGQDGWQVHSNWLTVTVTEPKGEDRALLDELGPNVRSLKYGHVAVQRLLDRYPRSPYLQLARVHAFSNKETRARQDGARQLVRELSAQPNWGAFEDVRLGFLERLARVSGDGETAERAARELKARYPRSPMTRALRH